MKNTKEIIQKEVSIALIVIAIIYIIIKIYL